MPRLDALGVLHHVIISFHSFIMASQSFFSGQDVFKHAFSDLINVIYIFFPYPRHFRNVISICFF